MKQSVKMELLYITESLLDILKDDPDIDGEQLIQASKVVEIMCRYTQCKGSGPGYMKMTKADFLSAFKGFVDDESYEDYVCKADDIELEGGFLSSY